MKHRLPLTKRILTAALPALLLAGAGINPALAGAPVARWNLGEQDPGAVAGNIGNGTTTSTINSPANDLTIAGGPIYDSTVPAGTGSTLSMSFAGGSYYRSDTVAALTNGFDYNNFGLSFDCYPTSNPGYNAPVSMGLYSARSSFFYITGGTWHYNMNGGGDVTLAAATLNAWNHLEFRRVQGTNYWYLNGTQVGPVGNTTVGAGSFAPVVNIGGIAKATGTWDTGGDWQGYVDNVVITNFNLGNPPTISSFAASPAKIYQGNSIILSATVSGDPAGLTYTILTNGMPKVTGLASLPYYINGATTNNNADYQLVAQNSYGAVTSAVATVSVLPSGGADVMKFRMGDNDPGAAAGNAGNAQTVDAILGNNLDATGSPVYSSTVPAGGGTLSMAFDGFSSYYRNTNLTAFLANLDQANYSLSFDVNCTALGAGGFSFPITLGRNGGGMGLVEIGGVWQFFRMGVGGIVLGPVQLNTWMHVEIQRRNFDTAPRLRVFVNGQDMNFQATTYSVAWPILTVGANTTGDGVNVEGLFNGLVDNVVIQNYSIGALPTITSGPTALPDSTIATGEALTLTATISGGTPANYRWRRNGTVLINDVSGTTSTVLIPNPLAGNYDVIVSNSPQGVVTSSIVAVTIDPRSESPLRATYNLGEQDPGAADGVAGNALTRQFDGLKDLDRFGTPAYNANVPAGGSALAMSLNGSTDWYGRAPGGGPVPRWQQFFGNGQFLPSNFTISADVYPTGDGADGFSIPFSIGHNGPPATGGGMFVYHAGGTWFLHLNGVGNIVTGPAVALNTWQNLNVVRKNFGAGVETHLYVNGVDAGGSSQAFVPAPAFSIGAHNRNRAPGDPKPYEGYFKGLVDNVVVSSSGVTVSLTLDSGWAIVDCHGRADTTYRLLVSPGLSPAAWTEVTSGTTDANGYIQMYDFAPPAGQAFYRVVAP
jgi:hypothetical protein